MRMTAFCLSWLLIFVIPWENLIMSQSGSTISKAIGLFVGCFWATTVAVSGRLRRPRPFHVVLLLFVVWNAFSLIWSCDIERSAVRVLSYVQQLVLTLILWDLYTTPLALKAGLQAYVLGAYVSGIATIQNYLSGSAYYYDRYAASGFNPNDLGLILALGIPFAWHLTLSAGTGSKTVFLKLLNGAYPPLAIFVIFLTASRGTLIAAASSLVFIVASIARLGWIKRVAILVAALPVLVILQGVVPEVSVDRLRDRGFDFNGRIQVWAEGLAVAAEHPMLGVGSGAFRSATDSGRAPHNFALAIFGEVGLIGLVLFSILLLQAGAIALQHPKGHRGLWLTILAIWMLGAAPHNWEWRKQTWLIFGLLIASGGLFASSPEPWGRAGEAFADSPRADLTGIRKLRVRVP